MCEFKEYLAKRLLERVGVIDSSSINEVEDILDVNDIPYREFWKELRKRIIIHYPISILDIANELVKEKEK